jgi:hypothetical protein
MVAARVLELAPLLASSNLSITLINEAKAAPDESRIDAERKALQYFGVWINAMRNAGPAAGAKFRPILDEIERAAIPAPYRNAMKLATQW